MSAAYRLPVPYFIIDVNLDILECSALAEEQFPVRASLLDILDEGSRSKAIKLIQPTRHRLVVELNFLDRAGAVSLYEVYQSWQEAGTIVCIPRQSRINQISDTVREIQQWSKRDQPQERTERYGDNEELDRARSRELRRCLVTMMDILTVIRPSLIEADKSEYADLLVEQIEQAGRTIE